MKLALQAINEPLTFTAVTRPDYYNQQYVALGLPGRSLSYKKASKGCKKTWIKTADHLVFDLESLGQVRQAIFGTWCSPRWL